MTYVCVWLTQGYRDRASERRQLYGQDDKPKSLTQERRMERLLKMQAQAPPERAHPPPEPDGPVAAVDRPLGDDNIGASLCHMTTPCRVGCKEAAWVSGGTPLRL